MNEALGDIRNLAFVYKHVLEEEIPPEWLELLTRLDDDKKLDGILNSMTRRG